MSGVLGAKSADRKINFNNHLHQLNPFNGFKRKLYKLPA